MRVGWDSELQDADRKRRKLGKKKKSDNLMQDSVVLWFIKLSLDNHRAVAVGGGKTGILPWFHFPMHRASWQCDCGVKRYVSTRWADNNVCGAGGAV